MLLLKDTHKDVVNYLKSVVTTISFTTSLVNFWKQHILHINFTGVIRKIGAFIWYPKLHFDHILIYLFIPDKQIKCQRLFCSLYIMILLYYALKIKHISKTWYSDLEREVLCQIQCAKYSHEIFWALSELLFIHRNLLSKSYFYDPDESLIKTNQDLIFVVVKIIKT